MTFAVIILVLYVGWVAVSLIRRSRAQRVHREINPEQAMKAAVELHRIRRRLDGARIKSEQRSAGVRLRREIGELLKEEPDGD